LVSVVPGFFTLATRLPEVGDDGGVVPVARRIITPAKSGLVGSTQESDTEESVTAVTLREVTGAGGAGAVVANAGRADGRVTWGNEAPATDVMPATSATTVTPVVHWTRRRIGAPTIVPSSATRRRLRGSPVMLDQVLADMQEKA
jgi:hypothetical protein